MKLIGIMVGARKLQQEILTYYLPYNEFSDVMLFSFTPKSINWKRKKIKGKYKQNGVWKTKMFRLPDCVINQTYSSSIRTVKMLEQAIGINKVFNRVNRLSKWKTYEILSNSHLVEYIPETWLYENILILELLKEKKSLYFKPVRGSLGLDIFKVTEDLTGFHIYITKNKPQFTFSSPAELLWKITELTEGKKYLVQEEIKPIMIKNQNYFEARIIVQKGLEKDWRITARLAKIVTKHSIISNLANNVEALEATFKKLSLSYLKKKILQKKISKIAIQTATVMDQNYGHMGEMSVDMMITNDGDLKIIEVNGMPSKKIIQSFQDDLIQNLYFSNPIRYAYSIIGL